MLKELQPIKELWQHQKKGVALARMIQNVGFFFDVGTGKSATLIQSLREEFATNGVQKTVIFAPKSILFAWKREIHDWSKLKDEDVVVLKGSGFEKSVQIKALNKRNVIIITNYELCRTKAWDTLVSFKPNIIVYDEAHKLKTYNSLISKKVKEFSPLRTFVLTGTPVGAGLLDLFGISLVLDKKLLGHNFFIFRNTYFYDKNAAWSARAGHFPDWQPRPNAENDIMKKLEKNCIQARAKDCIDLPEKITKIISIMLPEKIRATYLNMLNEWVASITAEDTVIAEFAITKAMKLRQIACGFIYETEENKILWLDDFRVEALDELLEQIPSNESVIVWVPFIPLYERVGALGKKHKRSVSYLIGGQSDDERQKHLDDFTNGTNTLMVANAKAGGTGTNLQIARHAVWFAHDTNSIDHAQAAARNFRGGSIGYHKSVVHYHFIAKDTIDEQIYESLVTKKKLVNLLLDMLQ